MATSKSCSDGDDGSTSSACRLADGDRLGLLLMPLTTMWHEIGGHALACAVQDGRVTAIGAFYVNCEGLSG